MRRWSGVVSRGHVLVAWYAVALLVDVAVTVARWRVVGTARYAGHADTSFYFQAARNLAAGNGLTVDFVWHFLHVPAHLHHYAADYWQPLPSILMAVPMKLSGGRDLGTALQAPVLAAALVPLAAAWLARVLGTHRYVPPATLALVALLPGTTKFAVQAESVPFYALFATVALALACARTVSPVRWLFAGASAGAAYLCRNDGALLVAVVGVALVVRLLAAWRDVDDRPGSVRAVGAFALGLTILLAPWLVTNVRETGGPLPPSARTLSLETYEDLFSIHDDPGGAGLFHGDAGRIRSKSIVRQSTALSSAVGPLAVLGVIFLAGVRTGAHLPAVRARRWRLAGWPLVITVGAAVFAFHTLVTPVISGGGAWVRSVNAFAPALVIAALDGLARLASFRFAGLLLAATIAVEPLMSVAELARRHVRLNNERGERVLQLGDIVADNPVAGRPPVVMTRNPWELTEVTGFPAVQIPNDDLCTIVAIARKYGVTHLARPSRIRPALGDVEHLRANGFLNIRGTGVYRLVDPTCHAPPDP